MRLQQFLEKLSSTPRAWFLDANGCIRIRDEGDTEILHCPLSRVGSGMLNSVYRTYGAAFGGSFGRDMGLSEETSYRIMHAADDDGYPTLRRRLLRACGLTGRGREPTKGARP
jgi:hypothetical protein